jgi:hypothetical protein
LSLALFDAGLILMSLACLGGVLKVGPLMICTSATQCVKCAPDFCSRGSGWLPSSSRLKEAVMSLSQFMISCSTLSIASMVRELV